MFFIALIIAHVSFASELPPAELIHIGEKHLMLENAANGTISLSAWNEFIVGEKTKWKLPPYRRGLYGGASIDGIEAYIGSFTGSSKKPWAQIMTLKEECQLPESSSGLYEDDRFGAWVIEHINELLKEVPQCLNAAGDCNTLLTGNFVHANDRKKPCDEWILRYLEQNRIRVVKDIAFPKSWYIRDRDCIQTIKASPRDLLAILSTSTWRAGDDEIRESDFPRGTGLFRLLVASLRDVSGAVEELALIAKKASGTSADKVDQPNDRWLRQSVPELIASFERCQNNGQLEDFRNITEVFERKYAQVKMAEPAFYFEAIKDLRLSLRQVCTP